jgi:lactate dehydrogenase-like 2-hydroxyacid dehydrogenase
MTDLSTVTVLVPGNLHPRAVERIGQTFRLVRMDAAQTEAVTPALSDEVRAIAAMTRIDDGFIDSLPKLEIIANFGVGYDAVDAVHAGRKGVMVTNTPDVLTEEVADTALGLLLSTVRDLSKAEAWLREGRWSRDGAFPLSTTTLRGRRVGIFGMGRIGQSIARRLAAMDLEVGYHNRRPVEGVPYRYYPSLIEMARDVDTLVSVAPGGAATDKILGAEVFDALGPDGVFINVGRGSTVDEDALIAALKEGRIARAGLDVFAREPGFDPRFLDLTNATLFPHIGSSTTHTRGAMADLVFDNLVSWFGKGKPLTPVPETAGR